MQLYTATEAAETQTQQEAGDGIGWPAPEDGQRMQRIEAIIRQSTFDMVKLALRSLPIDEMIVTEVRSCGQHGLRRQFYRGTECDVLEPRLKLEMLVPAARLADVIKVLRNAQPPHAGGQDWLLVYDLAAALRIPADPDPLVAFGSPSRRKKRD